MTIAYQPKESTFIAQKHPLVAKGIFAGCIRTDRKNDDNEVTNKFVILLKDASGVPVNRKSGFVEITIEEDTAKYADMTLKQGELVALPIQVGVFKTFLTVKHDKDLGLPTSVEKKVNQ